MDAEKLGRKAAEARERRAAKAERERSEYEAMIARDFPPALLEPWEEMVAAERPNWQAGMLPLAFTHGTPAFTAKFSGDCDSMIPTRFNVTITGEDRAAVLRAAGRFEDYATGEF